MIKEEIKFQNSVVFEGMTSIRAIIKSYDNEINDRQIKTIYYDANKLDKNIKNISYLKAVSKKYGFEVVESDSEYLDKMTLGNSHGGIVAIAGERSIPLLTNNTSIKNNGFYAMIEGIEDPYNFGYAIRSLYACGCDGIILQARNWFTAAGVVARSSAGSSELIEVYTSNSEYAVDLFKEHGYTIICAHEDTEDILGETEIKYPVLLIVGGEKRGISKKILSKTDKKIKIAYGRNFNASLSAASATTMFAYEIMRQKRK